MIAKKEASDFALKIEAMSKRLSAYHILITEFSYFAEAYGSWRITGGAETRQLTFSYDGQVSYLQYRDASISPKDYNDFQHKRFKTHEGEDPLKFLEDLLIQEFRA